MNGFRVLAMAVGLIAAVVMAPNLTQDVADDGSATHQSDVSGVSMQAAGGAPDSDQRVNVQVGKHGRDASANANATVRAVAPAAAPSGDAADEEAIRRQVEQEIERTRREIQERRRREQERNATDPDD